MKLLSLLSDLYNVLLNNPADKKLVFRVIVFVYLISNVLIYSTSLNGILWIHLVTLFITVVVSFLGYVYIYKKSLRYKHYYRKTLFVLIFIILSQELLPMFPALSQVFKICVMLLIGLYLYILLLSENIYLVSENLESKLPLLYPAKLFVFITLILNTFIALNIIYKFHLLLNYPLINLFVQILLIISYFILTVWSCSWYFFKKIEEGDLETSDELKSISIASVLVLSLYSISNMFLPYEVFGKSILVSIAVYIVINFIENYLKHNVNLLLYIKSILLMLISYILVSYL